MRRWIGFLLLVILAGLLVACGDENNNNTNEEEAAVISVETDEVVEEDLVITRSVFGRVGLRNQEPVMVDGPGEVKELHVRNGDKVNEDDVLVTVKSQMGDIDVKAPRDGVVASLSVREEEKFSGEDPLAIIADLDKMEASFQLSRHTRDLLEADDKVNILYDEEKIEAVVEAFDVLPNDSGQFDVDVTFDNPEKNALAVGDVVTLEVEEKRVKDSLVVPTAALLTADDEEYVFIIDGDQAKKVVVDVIELQSDLVAVEGDLSAGDDVIVRGQFLVEDGSEVSVEKDGNES